MIFKKKKKKYFSILFGKKKIFQKNRFLKDKLINKTKTMPNDPLMEAQVQVESQGNRSTLNPNMDFEESLGRVEPVKGTDDRPLSLMNKHEFCSYNPFILGESRGRIGLGFAVWAEGLGSQLKYDCIVISIVLLLPVPGEKTQYP